MDAPYASGKHIYLRAPRIEDADGAWVDWMNDEETTKWLAEQFWPKTRDDQRNFIENSNKDKSRLVLMAVDRITNKLIGVCSLSSINYVHRYCSIAIIIGDRDYRHGDYLIETFSILLRIAFKRLNMRYVRSAYVDGNDASEMLHRIFRFVGCGTYPETFWDGEVFRDIKLLTLAQQDWLHRNPD